MLEMNLDKRFDGKVIVVTGSSRGIGKAVALKFAKRGARIVINSRSSIFAGSDTVEQIRRMGGEAIYIQADLEEPEHARRLIQESCDKLGAIDILVNNAGRTVSMPFLKTSKEHWLGQLEANLLTTVFCSLEAVKMMKERGSGKIINTASVRGIEHMGRARVMAYSAAKAAVINFTKTLAKELAPDITVNAVAPGFVRTSYMDSVPEELQKQWLDSTPAGRFVTVDEVADAYVYLATAEIVTGEILVVDGGLTLKVA